jgi:hypothetical protein
MITVWSQEHTLKEILMAARAEFGKPAEGQVLLQDRDVAFVGAHSDLRKEPKPVGKKLYTHIGD